MTDIEDQLRRYAEAIARTQRPVAVGDVMTRRSRRPRARLLTGIAAVVCVVVIAGFVIVEPGRHHRTIVEVAPTTTRVPTPSLPPRACPAALLPVTSAQGEQLSAGWLPAGFVLSQGSETDLGARGGATYTPPGTPPDGGDPPRVALLRYHTTGPLASLSAGTTHLAATVQGHAAVVSEGGASTDFTSVAWTAAPGTALVVTGYKLSRDDLLQVANGVRYEPGTTLTYPAHPTITVSQDEALASIHDTASDGRAVLSSVGEVDAITHPAGPVNHQPTIAPDLAVTTPVWVVWDTPPTTPSQLRPVVVIDADTGARLAADPGLREVANLTDRSQPGCEPPFGVLTRSEILALRPTEKGTTQTATLTTLGRFVATRTGFGFAQCGLNSCDPTVPVWVMISAAPDQRFVDREDSPLGPRATTVGPSFQVIAYDARTGPQDTGLNGAELGSGRPPADLVALRDLAKP